MTVSGVWCLLVFPVVFRVSEFVVEFLFEDGLGESAVVFGEGVLDACAVCHVCFGYFQKIFQLLFTPGLQFASTPFVAVITAKWF